MNQREAVNWIDRPEWRKGRYVWTQAQLHIPGLRMFGKHQNFQALAPLPPHYHENAYEMTYLTKGSLRFSTAEQAYDMAGGDLLILHPGVPHDTDGQPMTQHAMYWFQLDPTQQPFLFLAPEAAGRLSTRLEALPQGIVHLDARRAQQQLEEVFQCFCCGDASASDTGAALLVHFLHTVANGATEARFPLDPDIGHAAAYVLDHIEEEMTLEALSAVARLSLSRFKEKFKRQMGLTPREYINAQRIRAACEALRAGAGVTDTAMKLGFSSSSYFAVVFKRHTGLSPSQYRAHQEKT